ncbi:hypothetical protein [Methylobacterium nonmethylotrophicum]|nr:hypothetical protein [Methylobacterium nonmethylotrophicum]
MVNRLTITELAGGRVAVSLRRSGQDFPEDPAAPIDFSSPLGAAEV